MSIAWFGSHTTANAGGPVHRARGVIAVAMLVALVTQAAGQDAPGAGDLLRWVRPASPGCVVAVSHRGEVVLELAEGLADLERNVPLRMNSVFDVGSLRKQFIAAAVLLLVDDGRLALTDDVRSHVPELPDTGHRISVDHLLTHTSGIRDWTGIAMLSGGDEDALAIILRQHGLNFAPGEEWSYSNSGYVLLTEIVERTSGAPFAEFAAAQLFEPLGMRSTHYVDDLRGVIENRALAYERLGEAWRQDVLLDHDRGGGGALFSTAGDLITWNEAMATGRLGAFVTRMLHEPARLNTGRTLAFARGFFLDTNRGGRVVWHTGSAGGYKSLLVRYPEHELSIALLCNGGEGAQRMATAQRIHHRFIPAVDAPMAAADAPRDRVDTDRVDVRGRAGLYLNERTGASLRLVEREGALHVAGGPRLEAVAGDRFRHPDGVLRFMSQDEFELHFRSDDELDLHSMEGRVTRYHRARPVVAAPGELSAVAGRYESLEIGAVFRVAAEGNGVRITLEHAPDTSQRFRPIGRDTFQGGRMTVRFRRDDAGRVVDLDYSNPMLRNVPFTRLPGSGPKVVSSESQDP